MSDGEFIERVRTTVDLERLERILDAVRSELVAAIGAHSPSHSDHEAFAVLYEEFDELWDAVKLNPKRHPERGQEIELEAVQTAAMAVRLLYDRGAFRTDADLPKVPDADLVDPLAVLHEGTGSA